MPVASLYSCKVKTLYEMCFDGHALLVARSQAEIISQGNTRPGQIEQQQAAVRAQTGD